MDNIAQNTIYQVKNERMGGFIPSWDAPKHSPENEQKSFVNVLSSYNSIPETVEITSSITQKNKLGILDLVDMVNPLQHIPLVNMAYRGLTGDEIKPVSKVIGGGVFGGIAGLASGIADVIIEKETGKDIAGNIMSIAGINNKKQYNFDSEYTAYKDLPVSLLAFAEMPITTPADKKEHEKELKYAQAANGRTAGTIAVYS